VLGVLALVVAFVIIACNDLLAPDVDMGGYGGGRGKRRKRRS